MFFRSVFFLVILFRWYNFLLFDQHWSVRVQVYWRTSLTSSSLLLQQCSAWLVRLIWMVSEIGCGGRTAALSWEVASKICSIWLVAFLTVPV